MKNAFNILEMGKNMSKCKAKIWANARQKYEQIYVSERWLEIHQSGKQNMYMFKTTQKFRKCVNDNQISHIWSETVTYIYPLSVTVGRCRALSIAILAANVSSKSTSVSCSSVCGDFFIGDRWGDILLLLVVPIGASKSLPSDCVGKRNQLNKLTRRV